MDNTVGDSPCQFAGALERFHTRSSCYFMECEGCDNVYFVGRCGTNASTSSRYTNDFHRATGSSQGKCGCSLPTWVGRLLLPCRGLCPTSWAFLKLGISPRSRSSTIRQPFPTQARCVSCNSKQPHLGNVLHVNQAATYGICTHQHSSQVYVRLKSLLDYLSVNFPSTF